MARELSTVHTHRESKTKSLDSMRESEMRKVSHHVEKKHDTSEPKKRTQTDDQTEKQHSMKKLRVTDQGPSSHSLPVSSKHTKSGQGVRRESSRKSCWMSSNLRVRIVDRRYCKGLYYNQKVCNICL